MNAKQTGAFVLSAFLLATIATAGLAAARPFERSLELRPWERNTSYQEALEAVADSPWHFKLWDKSRTYVLEGTYGNGFYVGTLSKMDVNGLESTGQVVWGGYTDVAGKPYGAFWGYVDTESRSAYFHGWFGQGAFVVSTSGGLISGHFMTWLERPA